VTGPDPAPAASPPPVARPRRRRGLWIALVASLAVNVFLVGWVASSWVHGPRFGPGARWGAPPPSTMAFQHRRAARALSGDQRDAANRIWRENFAELRNRAHALRDAHVELRNAYAADQADAKSLADAVAKFKASADGLFDHINATLQKIATALPADARKAYFSAGFARRERRGERPPRNQ
jgi:uncharacterized membrane protein